MQAPTRLAPASFLKHASEVASFYGFKPLREVERGIPNFSPRAHNFDYALSAAAARFGTKQNEPVLTYWASHSPAYAPESLRALPAGRQGETGEFGLHAVGVPGSIAEVVLLKTVATIMNEWGAQTRVRLNALGDKDSKARFAREVSLYLRKHANHLDPECREQIERNPFAAYACKGELCRSVVEGGPRAMNFLSEKSRAHFREMLEHLENLSLSYEFDDLLMGDEREPRMLFAIDTQDDATVLGGIGGRFDDHARKLSGRKELSGVSASIFFRKKGLSPESFKLGAPSGTPSVYFVQLGLRAKLEGLSVVDTLRRARIPVLQSFDWGHLSPQLNAARAAGVSHLLIMGAREALDGTILVRAMDNSSQQIVELRELPRYLKTLK